MQVVMMESEAYQNLIDRLERIEKYVVKTTERQAALDDDNVWLDNEQVCKLLDVSARSLQRYRSDGKLPYQMYGKKCCRKTIGNPLQGYRCGSCRRSGNSLHA